MPGNFSLLEDLNIHVEVPSPVAANREGSLPDRAGNRESTFDRIFSAELKPPRKAKKSPATRGPWSKEDLRAYLSPDRHDRVERQRRRLDSDGEEPILKLKFCEPVSFEGTPLGKGPTYAAFKRGDIDEQTFLIARSKELQEEYASGVHAAVSTRLSALIEVI